MSDFDSNLALAGKIARRRYKVGMVFQMFRSVTVWATSPDEAAELVAAGNGAEAEKWDPEPIAVSAAEMGTDEAKAMAQEAHGWLQPNSDDRYIR